MVQNLYKDPKGINKNSKEVKKDRSTQVSTDINKNSKEVKKDRSTQVSTDINKNSKEVNKDRSTQVSTDINKNSKEVNKDRHKGIRLTVRISPEEYQYYSSTLSIFNGLTVNGKPVFDKFLSMPSFCKVALRFICNTYRDNLFTDRRIVEKMNDVDTIVKFLTFRDKY
jgi:hypothetical protein